LHRLSGELPSHLQKRMHQFAGDVRGEYRALIVLTWVTSILAAVMLVLLLQFFYRSVFLPLRVLVEGSRRVAGGEFAHRIKLNTNDEVAELGEAMNAMTTRFQEIRDDLDRQVRERTREVINSEKLASVGFLAAGVAHEINNPLASIAWAAESLESRLGDLLEEIDEVGQREQDDEVTIIRNYLRCIQDEAFRCKGITDSLLDYSRIGDVEKDSTDLRELVSGVIAMVRHLGRYREKEICFQDGPAVIARVNAQELKQVVLNLITNALDSLEPGGVVRVELHSAGGDVQIIVRDNGCGMDDEVLQHLFEPFFTRNKGGQGTGLGLSISFQIVNDHGGRLEASSGGPGRGSEFRIILPKINNHSKTNHEKEIDERNKAA